MLSHMGRILLIPTLILALHAPLLAQLEYADAADKARCEKYLETPLPEEATALASPKAWPKCNSPKLYWGIGVSGNYAAARRCAWAERSAEQAGLEPRYTVASMLGGSAMLMVLYANGEGIKRDLRLAMRFACETGHVDMLDDIAALETAPTSNGKKFEYCDVHLSMIEIGFGPCVPQPRAARPDASCFPASIHL